MLALKAWRTYLSGLCEKWEDRRNRTDLEKAIVTRKTTSSAAKAALLRPIGVIRSSLKSLENAPMQGSEGAPDAWLEVNAFARKALDGLRVGDQILVITWLHESDRTVLKVHPRDDLKRPLT